MSCIVTKTGLNSLLSDVSLNENKLATFIYEDLRTKKIIKKLLINKNHNFDDFDEVFQRSVFVFFEESKKGKGRLLNRIGGDAEGFYRLWWRVGEIVTLDLMREMHRHEQFDDDDHEDAAIQKASLLECCNSQRFEDKIESQMVFDRFNNIFDSKSSDKIKRVVTKAMKPKITKTLGRPKGIKRAIPIVSGIFKHLPPVGDIKQNTIIQAARLSAIRKLLGISIPAFAEKLGPIPKDRLVSYLYARVMKIPPNIIAQSEQLLKSDHNLVASKAAVDNLDINDLLAEWREAVGLQNESLAELIGVSFSTISRWESSETRPSAARIKEFNKVVESYAKTVARRKK